jgi:superfamily II DNA helicase RecQ
MLVFFRQIKYMAELYEVLETSLGERAYVNYDESGNNDDRNRLFDMYHMKTDQAVKDSICDNYSDPFGCIRVTLCSTSFSMGMNLKGVQHVVHYGSADDLDNYLQETGRAGRDPDSQCEATLLKYKRALGGKNISKDMKVFCTTNKCRRVQLLGPFADDPKSRNPQHLCCDNCSALCRCL